MVRVRMAFTLLCWHRTCHTKNCPPSALHPEKVGQNASFLLLITLRMVNRNVRLTQRKR